MTATLECSSAPIPVKLRNLSAKGALVEADDLPAEGTALTFRRGDLAVPAHVAWVRGRRCGIAFDEQLSPEDLLRHVPSPKPVQEQTYKRPGLSAQTLTQGERRIGEEWVWRAGGDKIGE